MAKRRSNNKGTIYQLASGRWRAQLPRSEGRISQTFDERSDAENYLEVFMNKKEESVQIAKLKDAALKFQMDGDWDDSLVPSGRSMNEFDPDDLVVVIYSMSGQIGLSRGAYRALEAPERISFYARSDCTAIKCRQSGNKVTNKDRFPLDSIYRVSHTAYVKKVRMFDKKKAIRYYFAAFLSEDGFLVIDHTNPFETIERND